MSIAACITALSPRPTTASAAVTTPARVDLSQDAAWLRGYQAGEPVAMERLFRTYAPYVMALLRNGCSGSRGGHCHITNQDMRMELMQEVFVRVLGPNMRSRYDASRPFTAFLRGVTRNVMLEQVRRTSVSAQRHVAIQGEDHDLLETWSPSQPLADELLEGAQDRALMQDFMATLSPAERRFLAVRFEGGQSQRDAAETLGLGRQQVRRMDDELRAKLEKFLRGRGVDAATHLAA